MNKIFTIASEQANSYALTSGSALFLVPIYIVKRPQLSFRNGMKHKAAKTTDTIAKLISETPNIQHMCLLRNYHRLCLLASVELLLPPHLM